MASSPGPTDYRRTLQRFFYRGVSLMPQDALPEGKLAFARNIRSYEEGTIEIRYGLDSQLDPALASPIHSIGRLNDTSASAAGGPAARFLGSSTSLFGQAVNSAVANSIDTGYSGDPLSFQSGDAYRTPRPYMYVADSARMRKFDRTMSPPYTWGIATPTAPPTAQLAQPQTTFLNSVDNGSWQGYGGNVTPVPPLVVSNRINTTVTQIIFDAGTTGMASVTVADFANFTPGCTVDIAAAPETVIVQSIHPPVGATTIAAILYDSGTTGPCSIQPTGGFSVGQIEAAAPAETEARYRELSGSDVPPRVTVTRTVDFPVDSLVQLGGVETVRITSVATGPDGLLSFRCTTLGTFAAGAAITGLASFRAYFTSTKSVGDAVTAKAITVTLTPATTGDPEVGGFQSEILGFPRNWALVGNRASTPDDIIRIGFKAEFLGFVEFVRLMLDVAPAGTTPFAQDYYVYEWRAADLIAAIQATSEAATSSFIDGQGTAVEHGQTSSIYNDQYAQGAVNSSDPVVGTTASGGQIRRPSWRGGRPSSASATQPKHKPFAGVRTRAAEAAKAAKAAPVVAGSSISRQLALGNDVWMTLECRVGDLTRIGTRTDLNLTLLRDACVYVQTLGTTSPMDLQMSDAYLTGGYGPDIGLTLPPYVYRYSYRSTLTGERSNTSPPMRAGVRPQRGRVDLAVPQTSAAQCNAIDVWRFGGALAEWTYVMTTVNTPGSAPATVAITDDMADERIDGGLTPRVDLFQPWPVSDTPRTGTCRIAGTSVLWLSGDTFNTSWAADTLIIINGRATSLFAQPASTTRLEVVDNVGSGDVAFEIPSPLLVSQPLPVVFGGLIDNTLFHFACGDPQDPGILHWSNANDPDSSSDVNNIAVAPASEPLMNGYMDDGQAYVFSTERLYKIGPTPGSSQFRVLETNCTEGLWARWALAVNPDGGCYFLNKSGIFVTAGGGEAIPITDPDLTPLFPHDGSPGTPIRNFYPIDFSQPDRLRLAIVGGNLYFDYVDTAGNACTWHFEPAYKRWTPDAYLEDTSTSPVTNAGAVCRLSEPGPEVLDHLIATESGQLYNYTIDKTTDDLTDINWAIWTPWATGDDPRAYKQWGDAILDFNPGGSVNGIVVTPVADNGNVALAAQTIGAGGVLRNTYPVEIGATSLLYGTGVFSRNFGLLIEGAVQSCDIDRPIFYLWEPAFLHKGASTAFRATDWEDLGYRGAKFVQGIVIRANTFGQQKVVNVEFDGPTATPSIAMQLALFHDGEQTIAYPQVNGGWQPFHAELVRLRGIDEVEWTLLDWRWVYEPAPEAATQWETQDMTFGMAGFGSVHDGVMAYAAPLPVELVVTHDQSSITYTLPATTGGDYQRVYVLFGPYKGKSVNFQWSSELPFRLYKRDCSVRFQPWGVPGGFVVVNPFGGPSGADAEI